MRLVRFALEWVEVKTKKVKRFIIGLDDGVWDVIVPLALVGYIGTLRVATMMEEDLVGNDISKFLKT